MIGHNQFRILTEIIKQYDYSIPLSRFLKSYFQRNRQMGSRDRKTVSSFVFNYFRSGNLFSNFSIEEKIVLSSFLAETVASPLLEFAWKTFIKTEALPLSSSTEIKLAGLKEIFAGQSFGKIFPFDVPLSEGIDRKELEASFLKKPVTWIRCRKEYIDQTKSELDLKNIIYLSIEKFPLALGFEIPVDLQKLESYEKGYFEVQDLSSQQTGLFFLPLKKETWWDCCAGSGGKSLLLNDMADDLKIIATDIRASSLINLSERFKKAGLKNYAAAEIDLSAPGFEPPAPANFDGIIVDAPCSGSGTWARSPEMLTGFEEESLNSFSAQQYTIVKNVLPFLQKGKPLVYITCSVFKEENEAIVEKLVSELPLQVEKMKLINGISYKADTLFAARLLKK